MKLSRLILIVCLVLFCGHLHAFPTCYVVALYNTPAMEDQSSIMKKGTKTDVTEYMVTADGNSFYCEHGGYCYFAKIRVNGQLVDALRLTNCRIDPSSKSGDAESQIWGFKPLAAAPRKQAAPSDSIKDIQIVLGECNNHSRYSAKHLGVDTSGPEKNFACDSAGIVFMNDSKKTVTIRFMQTDELKTAPMLGFSGVMDKDDVTLHVTQMYFEDPDAQPVATTADSVCNIGFEDGHMKEIVCFGGHEDSNWSYLAYVRFFAAPGQ